VFSDDVRSEAVHPAACASIASAIDSAARNGESVARRRYQRGSVYQNKAKTVWLGNYAEYRLDSDGAEKRVRREVVLGAVRKPDATVMSKREAQRLLQPYVDRINSSLSALARERKSATFDAFAQIWEQDYLSLSKASTQSTMRGHIKRLKSVFSQKDMRQISTGDLQRVIASMVADEYQPKTIRNLWATVRLIWDAALAQGYVDRVLPKPRLPRVSRKVPKYFRLEDVAKIIAHSHGEQRVFYWLAAETGLRAGEIAGLRLGDVEPERISVSQSVWHGRVQAPKSDNALRTIAVSPQLGVLLLEQSERQIGKGHDFLFSSSTGSPWDASLFAEIETTSSYPRSQRSGVSRLPPFQCVSSIFAAYSAQGHSGTARACLSRITDPRRVHARGVGGKRGSGTTRGRKNRKSCKFCQLNRSKRKRASD
jgi:hypothetical protein